MRKISIDWSTIKSEEDMWDRIITESGSPVWHGRNLDALHDSWVNGDINVDGPPYSFEFTQIESTPDAFRKRVEIVMEIARESFAAHGGSIAIR
jgi:RNAse (barnase) inhibitor barstar